MSPAIDKIILPHYYIICKEVTNENRNVLGMMPHPERACEKILGSDDGMKIFESMLGIV